MINYFNDTNNITKKYNLNSFFNDTKKKKTTKKELKTNGTL